MTAQRSRGALCALLFAAALLLPARASGLFEGKAYKADWEKAATGQRVELSGTVRLVGNEPFSEFVVTDSEGRDWFIDAESAPLLRGLEHRPVRVTGTVERRAMTLANGKKLEDRRILQKLTVQK